MSESLRDHDKSSNNNFSQTFRNSKNDSDRHDRKRSHLDLDNIDAKVCIRNVPTKKATDEELLNFFKPYGKISGIQVFKDHIFVQYNRIDDANKLIKEAQTSLIFKGNKLDVLPAREMRSTSTRSSSTDRSSKSHDRSAHRSSTNYEPQRKRFFPRERSNLIPQPERIGLEHGDRMHVSSARLSSRRSSNESLSLNQQIPYAILTGPKNSNTLVDCQIIIVNARQREYAEEIESRLGAHGMITSVILLREDYTLVEAIDNAARLQCLYGIIAMPMHEDRRTASFHILYGQTEEHRNLTLEDGIHIIISNFISYKQRLHNDDVNPHGSSNTKSVAYSNSSPSYDYRSQSNNHSQESTTAPPVIHLGDKLPLSMLLCLLADGRQLTLEEIDRVLVYLLEKKAKMLTLPVGTLPPLPAQYASVTTMNHQTGSGLLSDLSSGKSTTSSNETSASIAEQIRQILSSNIIKANSSTGETISPPMLSKTSINTLSDNLKVERTIPSQSNNNIKESPKEYAQQQQNVQSSFSYAKSEPMPVAPATFNYASSSIPTTGTVGSFAAPNFSSFNNGTPSLQLNSGLKPVTSVNVPSFGSQPSQYFYPVPTQPVYQSSLNSTAANTAAALFQAYSQFHVQPTATSPIVNQQITTQQQQQIRK